MKTFEKRSTIDLSGFGGGYEETCQILLAIGKKWIENKPFSIWEGKGSLKKKYLDGKDGLRPTLFKELERAIDSNNITGTQADVVMCHLWYIHKHGRAKWLKDAKKHREPSDFFEWPQEGSKLLKK